MVLPSHEPHQLVTSQRSSSRPAAYSVATPQVAPSRLASGPPTNRNCSTSRTASISLRGPIRRTSKRFATTACRLAASAKETATANATAGVTPLNIEISRCVSSAAANTPGHNRQP